jgi:hypothetical protein
VRVGAKRKREEKGKRKRKKEEKEVKNVPLHETTSTYVLLLKLDTCVCEDEEKCLL